VNALLLSLMFSVGQTAHDAPVGAGRASSVRPAELNGAGIEQKLGQQVPVDLCFHDETGAEVMLKQFIGERPVVLVLAYFRCPMLCTEVLNGLFDSLPRSGLTPDQYEIVVISFDARETPDMANAKRKHYLEAYGRPGLADHVHFLTGNQESITALTTAVGFSYSFDAKSEQFAHPGMITLLTPAGTIARYFFGVRFQPRDLRLGLVEASEGKIGTLSDQIVLYCLYYDPDGATYAASVMRIVRIAGAVTVALLVGFVFFMRRRERRLQLQVPLAEGGMQT
jgi:protein SCO1/2